MKMKIEDEAQRCTQKAKIEDNMKMEKRMKMERSKTKTQYVDEDETRR